MSDVATEATGPTFETGSVNLDSLKHILSRFADAFPFLDETEATKFRNQIDKLHESGDPNAELTQTVADKDSEIADLQARIKELEANQASPPASSGPSAPTSAPAPVEPQ